MRWAWLSALVGLASCAGPPEQAVAPERPTIVSLNPCTDAILAEVTAPGQLLAISAYSQRAASSSMDLGNARRYKAIAGSVEEILALHPDIVVSGNFMPPSTVAALQGLGIKLVTLPIAGSVAESKAQVEQLAQVAGHAGRGAALNAQIDAALAAANPLASQHPQAVVWQSGGIVPGQNTLIADLLHRTGFDLLSAAKGMRQADVLPLEELLVDPPDLILTVGDARSNEDRMLAHPALAALKGTRREAFAASLLWCGGPTILRAAARLAEVRKAL